MPIRFRTARVSPTTSRPQTSARPALGSRTVDRILTRVVFPAPLGPSRPWTSPSSMARETASSATTGEPRRRQPAPVSKTRRRPSVRTACTLPLLGHPVAVLATAGADAAEYRDWLVGIGVDCRGLRLLDDELTATGYTTTDADHNNIWGYYGGAMWRAATVGLADTVPNP